jgi:hypothetical protein
MPFFSAFDKLNCLRRHLRCNACQIHWRKRGRIFRLKIFFLATHSHGICQGAVPSPLLANIYLKNELVNSTSDPNGFDLSELHLQKGHAAGAQEKPDGDARQDQVAYPAKPGNDRFCCPICPTRLKKLRTGLKNPSGSTIYLC